MLERELESLPFLSLIPDGLAADHHHVFKNLLSEIPMFGGCAATDVSGRE